jgi:hypothetical protein
LPRFLSLAYVFALGCGGTVRPGDVLPDGGADFGACTAANQCVLATNGCCPSCGEPQQSDFAAVNASRLSEFRAAVCPMPVPCPRCAAFPNLYIGARCVNARCESFDVRKVPDFSACTSDADCRLRKGLECCECGAMGEWTAVSVKGQMALPDAVCAPGAACDACAPVPPQSLIAVCNAGHCETSYLL